VVTSFAYVAGDDAGTILESDYSNEVSSWPRLTVNGATPTGAAQGSSIDFTLQGTNFDPSAGTLAIAFSDPAIQPGTTTVLDCFDLNAQVDVGCDAVPGDVTVGITVDDGGVIRAHDRDLPGDGGRLRSRRGRAAGRGRGWAGRGDACRRRIGPRQGRRRSGLDASVAPPDAEAPGLDAQAAGHDAAAPGRDAGPADSTLPHPGSTPSWPDSTPPHPGSTPSWPDSTPPLRASTPRLTDAMPRCRVSMRKPLRPMPCPLARMPRRHPRRRDADSSPGRDAPSGCDRRCGARRRLRGQLRCRGRLRVRIDRRIPAGASRRMVSPLR